MNRRFPKAPNPEALVPVTGMVEHPHNLRSVHRIQSAVEPAHSTTLALFTNAPLALNAPWSAVARHRFGYLTPGTAGTFLAVNRMTERRLAAGLNRCLPMRRLWSESVVRDSGSE